MVVEKWVQVVREAAVTKSDKVLWGLTAVVLSLFVWVEAKTMMLNLGAAMHDAHCQDH